MEVGLDPGTLSDMGTQLRPIRGTAPPILCPCLLWPIGWMDQDATWYKVGLSAGDTVLDDTYR